MKKILSPLILLILLTGCGKENLNNSNPSEETKPDTSSFELTSKESELKEKLLSVRIISQKELMKELLSFKGLSQLTLERIDKYIKVECSSSNGFCDITQRN